MKKILLLMAVILPFFLTSCGDDKDEPKQSLEEQLIGSWVGDEYTVVDGKVVVTHPHSAYRLFNADHTGKYWTVIDGVKSPDMNFTWSLKGNVLTLSNGSSEPESMEISIKDDVLHTKRGTIELDYIRAKG